MTKSIRSVRGMPDLLPETVATWQEVERKIRQVARLYGYREIRLPLLERTELFRRSIGEATDIVEKEMYTFLDNSDESLTLRPEATASCVRAGVQHGLFHNAKARLWYMGPMFRYERPQKGRFRQFHQFGVEAFGWEGPDIDAEMILLGRTLWKLLGIERHVRLEINSLGTSDARAEYRAELVSYFERHGSDLDEDSQRRLLVNPLRILDSKNPDMQEMLDAAPSMREFLGAESERHFSRLLSILDDMNVGYRVNPRLVRGLDYYSGAVYEWVTDELGAQNAICAGGRYDGLVEHLGGKAVPGAGFACGIERLVELANLGGGEIAGGTDVFVVMLGEQAQQEGAKLAEELRSCGVATIMNCGGGKISRQLKTADQLNASIAIIIGESELLSREATVKYLRADRQARFPFDQVARTIAQQLSQA